MYVGGKELLWLQERGGRVTVITRVGGEELPWLQEKGRGYYVIYKSIYRRGGVTMVTREGGGATMVIYKSI